MIQQNLKTNWKKKHTQENELDALKETGELSRMRKQDQRKNTRNAQNQAWMCVWDVCVPLICVQAPQLVESLTGLLDILGDLILGLQRIFETLRIIPPLTARG